MAQKLNDPPEGILCSGPTWEVQYQSWQKLRNTMWWLTVPPQHFGRYPGIPGRIVPLCSACWCKQWRKSKSDQLQETTQHPCEERESSLATHCKTSDVELSPVEQGRVDECRKDAKRNNMYKVRSEHVTTAVEPFSGFPVVQIAMRRNCEDQRACSWRCELQWWQSITHRELQHSRAPSLEQLRLSQRWCQSGLAQLYRYGCPGARGKSRWRRQMLGSRGFDQLHCCGHATDSGTCDCEEK